MGVPLTPGTSVVTSLKKDQDREKYHKNRQKEYVYKLRRSTRRVKEYKLYDEKEMKKHYDKGKTALSDQ